MENNTVPFFISLVNNFNSPYIIGIYNLVFYLSLLKSKTIFYLRLLKIFSLERKRVKVGESLRINAIHTKEQKGNN